MISTQYYKVSFLATDPEPSNFNKTFTEVHEAARSSISKKQGFH